MTCAITTSFLGCLVTGFLFFRYTMCLDMSLLQRALVFMGFMLMGCIPLMISYQVEPTLGKFYPVYRYGLYFIYIGCVILFTVTLLSDALFLALSYTPWIGSFKEICSWLNPANIALAVLFTSMALYAGTKVPEVKFVQIETPKLQSKQTIAILSDLHIHRTISETKIKEIVARTNAQNPDVILLVGDIIDDEPQKVAETTALLKGLKAKNGVYFVSGNHEFYAGYAETVEALQALGFNFLENNGAHSGQGLYLGGVPDVFSAGGHGKKIDLSQAFANAPQEAYRILLSHTPKNFGMENNFDLEVSGHTHGGQIFPFHIFAKLHNIYLSGLYDLDNKAKIYVSNGAGQWGPQMRFLAPAEITILKLTPKHEEK